MYATEEGLHLQLNISLKPLLTFRPVVGWHGRSAFCAALGQLIQDDREYTRKHVHPTEFTSPGGVVCAASEWMLGGCYVAVVAISYDQWKWQSSIKFSFW